MIKRYAESLLAYLFPRRCVACETVLAPDEKALCFECFAQLDPTHYEQRPRNNPVYDKIRAFYPIDFAISAFYYDKDSVIQKAIHALKYEGIKEVGLFLGMHLGFLWKRNVSADLQQKPWHIVPLPLHPRRERERGYNQAFLLAVGFSKITQYPITQALKRVQYTKPQALKGQQERWENMKAVFSAAKTIPSHMILIDDVLTTGATLMAAIATLLSHSPCTIGIITLATPRSE